MQTQTRINAGALAPIKSAVTCAVAALFMAHPVWALNNRSWVVSFGSDQNNCTALFPCRTFQHAHDVTNAGGEVDVLDAGDYGTLIINKPITIDGGNMGYIQVSIPGANAIEVSAPATGTVILRNLSIGGFLQGFGIVWNTGQGLSIEGVSIYGVYTGIVAQVASSTDFPAPRLLIKDVTIRNCSQTGILISGFASGGISHSTKTEAVVEHATIENTAVGVSQQGGKANIVHSVISHASVAGIQTDGEVNVADSSILYSKAGLYAFVTGAIISIAGDNIHDNAAGLQFGNGGQIVSFGDNRILGNGSAETPSSTVGLK